MVTKSDLKAAADKLNAVSEDVNAIWRAVEAKINALNLGVEVEIEMNDRYSIIYGRIHSTKKWGIIIASDKYDEIPILNAARAIRVQALDYIVDLLNALTEDAINLTQQLKDAKKNLDDFLVEFDK